MAYERYNEQGDDQLMRQLEEQQNRTQPVGSPTALGLPEPGPAYRAGSVDPRDADPASGYGKGGVENPAYKNPLGGSNTGVTGGANMGTPTAGGGADMEWRKSLKYGGGPGTMSGFNTTGEGYNDKAANSVKNTFGRIAQRYPATPEGLRQAFNDPDFKRAFPNARMVEGGVGDKIDFGGVLSDFESGTPVGVVDVGQAFDPSNNSGTAWAWMPEGEGGDMGGDGMGGGGLDMNSLIAGITGGNAMDGIQSRIDELINGQDPESQTLIQKILAGEVQI